MNKKLTKDELYHAMQLDPKLAVDYFRSLGVKLPNDMVEDAITGARAKAFTIANSTSIDVINATKLELDRAISEGLTSRQFIKNLQPKMESLGFAAGSDEGSQTPESDNLPPYRLKQIYRANTSQAYNTGRYITQVANAENQPYWLRVEVMDQRTRSGCAAVHNTLRRWDDPWWESNYPPYLNGNYEFGCRGRVRSISDTRLAAMQDKNPDLKIEEPMQASDKSYNVVGSAQFGSDIQIAKKIVNIKDRNLRSNVIQGLNSSKARAEQYQSWVSGVLAKAPKFGGSLQPLGFVAEDIAQWMATNKPDVRFERLAAISEKDVGHIIRDKHVNTGAMLTNHELLNLDQILKNPNAVYIDETNNRICYLSKKDENGKCVVVILGNAGELKKKIEPVSMTVTSYRVNHDDFIRTRKTRIK